MIVAKNKEHLKELIKERIDEFGNNCDLNDIDVSGVTDMSRMFQNSQFNGDISQWNVSKVTDMFGMFYGSPFNQDISKWEVNCEFSVTNNFDNYKFLPKNINGDIYFYYDINPKIILPLCLYRIKGKWYYSNVKNETLKKALSIMKSNYKKYGFGEECLNETRNQLISNNLEIYSYLEIEDLYFNHPHEFI